MARALLLTLALCLLAAAPASASTTQGLTFEAPRDLLNPDTREATFAELDDLGVRSLRVILYWRDVAPGADSAQRPGGFDPAQPAGYDWSRYDPVIAGAAARGWPVILTVSGPVPKWATRARRDNLTRPSASAFGAFMQAVGRRYGASIDTWAIWNEPNQPQFLRPQFARGGRAVSPGIYRGLFQAAVRGLEAAGQGDDRVLMGETSPTGTGRVVAPLTFLRGALCLDSRYRKRSSCKALPADGYAHHAYTRRSGPFFVPRNRNDVSIGVLSRLTTALDRATRAGALPRRLPVYLTEFGIQSTPDRISGVPLAQQPEFYALSERIARGNPRVVSFSQYLLRDDNPTGPDQFGGFESGLRFADGRIKPSHAGFRLPLSARKSGGGRVSLWGRVRPATTPVAAEVLFADRGRSFRRLRTVRTDRQGSFSFRANDRSGRRWRLRWTRGDGKVFTGPPIRAYGARRR
jgi:hypothetical protein